MTTARLIEELTLSNVLGEGVIWDAAEQVVWWTDIQSRALFQYRLDSGQLKDWSLPERLCCLASVKDSTRLIAAFESGFAFFEPATGSVEWLMRLDQGPGLRLNDGRADRQGRFWAGSMHEGDSNSAARGTLYCLDRDLSVRTTLSGLRISNSLCWSPDAHVMYHADTPNGRIDRYDFDAATGTPTGRSTFARTAANHGPDGSTVDADGCVWNAQWGGSKIVRYTPEGEIDFELPLPVSQPTCVAFGGPNLDLLFVTSANDGLSADARRREPRAGNLFVFQTDTRGIQEPSFMPQR